MADLTDFGQQFKKTIVNTLLALRDNEIEEWDALHGKEVDEAAATAKEMIRDLGELTRGDSLYNAQSVCNDFQAAYDEWDELVKQRRTMIQHWDAVIARAEEKL